MSNLISSNRKARYLYKVSESWEAGIVLSGWEVKSIRKRKVQITESYIYVKEGEAFILNMIINPLVSTCTHNSLLPSRPRKLLMHKKEILKLSSLLDKKGCTAIPLDLHWKGQIVKLKLGIATGRSSYDKRQQIRDREWKRTKDSWE